MEQIDKQRFFTMAEAYDRMCRHLVPGYDFLQDETLRIAAFDGGRDVVVIDLGAGSGIFLERVLARWPAARCYWVDYSEDFCQVAQQWLAPFADRVAYVLSTLEDAWEPQVGEQADLVFSMSAIHHLESGEKRALYRRAFDVLKPGGWFFNVDEMRTLHRDGYLANMRFWVRHVREARETMPDASMPYYERWSAHFDNWQVRNVDGVDQPKVKGDDIHEGFVTQVDWLREIGFAEADVYLKYHLWCAVGGRKGTTTD